MASIGSATGSAVSVGVKWTCISMASPAIALRPGTARTARTAMANGAGGSGFEVGGTCPAAVYITEILVCWFFFSGTLMHSRVICPGTSVQALTRSDGWCRTRTCSVHVHHRWTATSLGTEVGWDVGTTGHWATGGMFGVVQRETVHVQRVSHVG